ncbi:uncharacterized protein LOC135848169 [Planococcus citri]|uniref:uncharacterized protein LOC135848169 n=1 Tax=Planococcus citri TaxID=170843 RepID=UPI0031FA1BDF
MEVQLHQELEMAEVTSEVYDIIHPTPVSLKQLSAIAVSLQIWRCKVNEYRIGGRMKEFDPCSLRKENTWMKTMLPDLPSTIYKTIEEVASRFGHSMEAWQFWHYERGFRFQYTDENRVLEDFDDFVCDYDGSIHYTRTAERMMLCERFNSKIKFIVACMYFYEDDIRRIWPSVSGNMYVDFIEFDCPQLYYWICRLTNELDKIRTWEGITVDEYMFRECIPYNRPSVEYFWDRIPLESRMRKDAIGFIPGYDIVRFILPKLSDEQLDEFVNVTFGVDLCTMFLDLHCDEWVVLRTWFYIRNIINKSNFTNLIVHMLEIEDDAGYKIDDREKWEYLCCQIWNHSPATLKSSVIRFISSDNSWLEDFNQMNVDLLLTILQDASSEERNSFLRNCWSELTKRVRRKNLQEVVELCFENEDELNQFKRNVMINSRDMLRYCVALLQDSCFEELNAFASFCCAELQAARNLKQRILQSAFLDVDCKLSLDNIVRVGDLNEFVNDAFDNVDLSTDFKKELISSSSFMKHLWRFVVPDQSVSSLKTLDKFINTMFSITEEILMQAKQSFIDSY